MGEDITDANQVEFYVDGVAETISDSSSIAINTGGYPLVAGAAGYVESGQTFIETQVYPWADPNAPDNPGIYFAGSMDDLRVYNRTLSMGQIRKLASNEEYIKVRNTYTYNPYGEDFTAECNETVYNPFKYTGHKIGDSQKAPIKIGRE